jgi:hypothetical protein
MTHMDHVGEDDFLFSKIAKKKVSVVRYFTF